MFPEPINGHYTGPQRLEVSAIALVPGEIANIVLNVTGLVLFNLFKKNRKFPISILSWFAVCNVIYGGYLLAKFDKRLGAYDFLTAHVTPTACVVQVFFNTWFYYSEVCLNSIMAVVLFLSVVRRKDVEFNTDQRYFWAAIGFYLVFVPSFVFGYAFNPELEPAPITGICVSTATRFMIIPLASFLGVQVVLITWTLVTVYKIRTDTRTILEKRDKRMMFLIVRFGVTLVSQFFSVASYFTIFYTGDDQSFSPNTIIFCCVALAICPNLDAAVLIFSNRPLYRWLKEKYDCWRKNDASLKTSSKSKELQTMTVRSMSMSIPSLASSVNSTGESRV